MVRAPANVPRSGNYELFEGIIETDHWFGPLITNMRLTKTDVPIDFRADFPLLQVQPTPAPRLRGRTLNNYELGSRPRSNSRRRIGTTTTTPSCAHMSRKYGRAASMPPPRANGAPPRTNSFPFDGMN